MSTTPNNLRNGTSGRRGLKRFIDATGCSMSGLASAWRSEEAFRMEAALAIIMIPAAFWVGTTPVERILLLASVVLVIIVELLNTAVEYTVDRIGTERHHLSGGAKDLASAAVLLSLLLAGTVWGMLLWNRLASG